MQPLVCRTHATSPAHRSLQLLIARGCRQLVVHVPAPRARERVIVWPLSRASLCSSRKFAVVDSRTASYSRRQLRTGRPTVHGWTDRTCLDCPGSFPVRTRLKSAQERVGGRSSSQSTDRTQVANDDGWGRRLRSGWGSCPIHTWLSIPGRIRCEGVRSMTRRQSTPVARRRLPGAVWGSGDARTTCQANPPDKCDSRHRASVSRETCRGIIPTVRLDLCAAVFSPEPTPDRFVFAAGSKALEPSRHRFHGLWSIRWRPAARQWSTA
jgi:hypothetical protein